MRRLTGLVRPATQDEEVRGPESLGAFSELLRTPSRRPPQARVAGVRLRVMLSVVACCCRLALRSMNVRALS
jgi:hypothetical protein